jgi:polyisoprenoid-binding protein YceI
MRSSVIAAAFLSLVASVAPALASSWDVDGSHSQVGFSVRHMMISNTTGKFTKFTGGIELDDKDVTRSTVTVDIDVASIDTSDAKRDEHLRGEDFFDAKKFPKMTFRSTRVVKAGDRLQVTGDLTIRGVTRPVVLDVDPLSAEIKDPWGGTRRGAHATTKINRRDFGLTWNKALEAGGVAVGEDVTISLDLELLKKK